jgi:flagellar hook-associated protein 1 FlgK
MSNLLASMSLAGNALDAFQQAMSTTQNNVTNSSTEGYAKQTVNLTAQPFDITAGLTGGVAAQTPIDSRDQYAEESVQQATQALGLYTAQANATSTLQSYFDVTGTSGVSAALTTLFQSFSAWSESPNDSTVKQTVLDDAGMAAQAINSLASSLTQEAGAMDTQIGDTVNQINSIETQIQQYNAAKLSENGTSDAGTDAQLYSALDSLSKLVDFSTVTQSDGTVSVVLSGGTPLVMGTTTYPLSSSESSGSPTATYPNALPTAQVLDSSGTDITSEISSGTLGGQLDVRNRVLGSIMGNSQEQGSLNLLAQTLADTVNYTLETGTVSTAAGAASGTPLFTYDATNTANVAASIAVNPNITEDELAPVDSYGNANGNAQALAAMENATGNSTGTIGGVSMIQYFAGIASAVGTENTTASDNETTQTQVVSTATSLRDTVSGVSLDQEAANLQSYQEVYEAASKVLTTLDTMTEMLIDMMPPAAS